jgi:hypothetical protein
VVLLQTQSKLGQFRRSKCLDLKNQSYRVPIDDQRYKSSNNGTACLEIDRHGDKMTSIFLLAIAICYVAHCYEDETGGNLKIFSPATCKLMNRMIYANANTGENRERWLANLVKVPQTADIEDISHNSK